MATQLLVAANVLVFLACALASGSVFEVSGRTLLQFGALYSGALQDGAYWRLAAAGFLHLNLMHLLFNMSCLLSWGREIEWRFGTPGFLWLYAASLLGGSLMSVLWHPGLFISAGASGAIAGLLGALLYLAVRGIADISVQSVALNIGLNVALTWASPAIDWRAHLGGFAAGLVVCLVLGPAWSARHRAEW